MEPFVLWHVCPVFSLQVLPNLRPISVTRPVVVSRLANPPAPYRAQKQENLEIPFSESKNTLFDPLHGTHLNGRFGAFNFPLSVGVHIGEGN